MINIENTRKIFEIRMQKIAEAKKYRHMDALLGRDDNGDYLTTWVDSAWIGWCQALIVINGD